MREEKSMLQGSDPARVTELRSHQSPEDGLVAPEVLGCPMLITTGKVQGGTIKLDELSLPEGAIVTVLAPEGDETFELTPSEEAKLLTMIAEDERGETTSAADLLKQIRRS